MVENPIFQNNKLMIDLEKLVGRRVPTQILSLKPDSKLSVFLSPLTSRWVLVLNKSLSDKGQYGVPKGAHSFNEIGTFATVNYNNIIAKNINYKGRLDLFSNYKSKPQNVDLFMTNVFSFKINKHFSYL